MPPDPALHGTDSTSTPPPVLRAERLTKRVRGRTIVEDVSLDVHPGEIVGFLGPNGAGKTTTIRMLVGLIRPTAGKVRISGFDVSEQFEEATRCVGCIVEQPDLYRFLSGRENLEHFQRMLGSPREQIGRVAELVGLSHRLDDRVRTYSLGMRQRLGIAQALLGDPRLLILDEPANGLDPAGIREMRSLFRQLADEHDLGILISSHLLAEVEQVCDRVTIIHRGHVLHSGTVDELIQGEAAWRLDCRPDSAAVAVLRSHGIDAIAAGSERLEFLASADQIPSLVAALVAEGVQIVEIVQRRPTLEETFLDATHGESV